MFLAQTIEAPSRPSPTFDSVSDQVLDSDKPWHVVLLDDNDHTYEYVIEMLATLFSYTVQKAYKMACEVDEKGRVTVWTGHLERAEAYQEEIHEFGADPRMKSSKGPMKAVLEQAR